MSIQDVRASDIMMRPVVSARKKASARDIALQMLTGLYSGMPICDEEGRVVGVVTEIDLLRAAEQGRELVKTTADEIMSASVITADVDTPVAELMKLMTDNNIIRLPITDKGRLVGIVARCDVLKTLIEPEFVTYA